MEFTNILIDRNNFQTIEAIKLDLLTIENCLSVNPTMISRGENINLDLCGDDSALTGVCCSKNLFIGNREIKTLVRRNLNCFEIDKNMM